MAAPKPGSPATGKRLTAAKMAARDRALAADRLKPMTWASLAVKYGMSERSAREAYYRWKKENEDSAPIQLGDRDPIEIVGETVGRLESWITQLSEIANAPETGDAVRVGAINSQINAQQKLTDLLQATGILPKQLGKLRIEADIRYVAQTLVKVLQDEGVPDTTMRRVLEVLRHPGSNN